MSYNHQKIEKKWQRIWAKSNYQQFQAKNFSRKKKFYILDMFPYPSGDGLHVGHVEGYSATDIYSRYLRLNNFNVLHPMGWDAFGLPAENFAISHKLHPAVATQRNIERFKKQVQSLGFSYDWEREISTCEPTYYQWTQWIFLKLFETGLAYQAVKPINWCPSCKTGLANEDLEEGKCERCKSPIERKPMRQWLLKITAYADRLLADLKLLNWPENVKQIQRNWIGRSAGYEVEFAVSGKSSKIKVFTTRLDTLFGATFLVLAPEHPLIEEIVDEPFRFKVRDYRQKAVNKTDLQREMEKEKTGVFTGAYVINPANQKRLPVWVADYVMMDYGTGAVMGVPAHDQRDFEFAKKFGLEMIEVISADGKEHQLTEAYTGEGVLINSGPFNRLLSTKASAKIANFIGAKKAVYYKMEDWVFDRQRYWGEPIPLVFCQECKKTIEEARLKLLRYHPPQEVTFRIKNRVYSLGEVLNPGWVALPFKQLPLTLPEVKYYEPTGTGESPLVNIKSWVETRCPKCGQPASRETNTMPGWAGSCWYYLAFALGRKQLKLKPKDWRKFWDQKILKYWFKPTANQKAGGVDFYVGGIEHAARHLIYARFWHKFLYDLGLVPNPEPFVRLLNQGLILGPDGEKMSKSRGNVVNPDEIIEKYGADSLRIYEMFMGPLEVAKPWDTNGIIGVYRFLNRIYQLAEEWRQQPTKKQSKRTTTVKVAVSRETEKLVEQQLHQTIKKVTEDLEAMQFNTAVASLMELLNSFSENKEKLSYQAAVPYLKTFILLLFPFAPHLGSELWSWFSKTKIESQRWPKYRQSLVERREVVYAVQINGKLRDTLKVPAGLTQAEVIKKALASDKIKKWLGETKVKKTIFVKEKVVNFVV